MRYLFFLTSALIFLYVGCGEQKVKPNVNPNLNEAEIPAQESWDTKVIFSDSGRTTAILYAGHLRMFEQSRETLLDSGVRVDFYNPDEIKTMGEAAYHLALKNFDMCIGISIRPRAGKENKSNRYPVCNQRAG